MALTTTERAAVRRWLGYYDQTVSLVTRLEGRMNAITAEAEVLVRQWLDELAELDAQIRDARLCRLKVRSTGDVVLSGTDELWALYDEGNRLAGTIAQYLGVPYLKLPYSIPGSTGIAGLT